MGWGGERDFACGFDHSSNMSPIPEDSHLGHGPLWSHFNFTVTGFGVEQRSLRRTKNQGALQQGRELWPYSKGPTETET
jgi:hypothetical protein